MSFYYLSYDDTFKVKGSLGSHTPLSLDLQKSQRLLLVDHEVCSQYVNEKQAYHYVVQPTLAQQMVSENPSTQHTNPTVFVCSDQGVGLSLYKSENMDFLISMATSYASLLCREFIERGFTFEDRRYPCKMEDQNNYTRWFLNKDGLAGQTVVLKDTEKRQVVLGVEKLAGLFNAMSQHIDNAAKLCYRLKADLDACTHKDQVDAIKHRIEQEFDGI